jgi:hypothetical protein
VWRIVYRASERADLWRSHTVDAELAEELARTYRASAFGIHAIGRAAYHRASLQAAPKVARAHVTQVVREGIAGSLGSLAELLPDVIEDDALVLPPALRTELLALRQRCRLREGLVADLGPSSRTLPAGSARPVRRRIRHRQDARRRLACVAARAAAVPGGRGGHHQQVHRRNREKSRPAFSRAEHSDLVLLFDEADALFGKRTDVKESNDRFANAQTNYLLQRIESFEGIALLTSNSRARFDSAFTRRLDAVVEFRCPRRRSGAACGTLHLGAAHASMPLQ